jgi:hypothetical protein
MLLFCMLHAGHAMPMRTPRSSSKQQGQQQGKGQTNISQFFPSLTDGNSRDSETASLQHHHHQQQQPPSPLKDTAGQQQQQQQRPAAARGATPPPAAVAKAGADSSMQQQSRRSRGSIGSAAGAAAAAAGGGDANQAVAWQQQLAALQQKHQQELELARQEARCGLLATLLAFCYCKEVSVTQAYQLQEVCANVCTCLPSFCFHSQSSVRAIC